MKEEMIAALEIEIPTGYIIIAVDYDGQIHAYPCGPEKSFSCWIGFYSYQPPLYVGDLGRTVPDWADHCYHL